MFTNLLAPAAVLILWTLVMISWMFMTRMAGFKALNMKVSEFPPGGRGPDLEGVLPPKIMWKAHNYMHLLEQPTIFYPALIILHLSGGTSVITIGLAWAYVLLRICHSIWQATVNTVTIRLPLFFIGTICLVVLSVMTLKSTFAMAPLL